MTASPWRQVEPRGFATFWGAVVGEALGGGLGSIGVLLHLSLERLRD
ncbi:MAG: hypothetical protein IT445_00865 [Phycisphaeraceae bacterium]|nr:hypothetical protein [Phycisphaeraceae bacterium]